MLLREIPHILNLLNFLSFNAVRRIHGRNFLMGSLLREKITSFSFYGGGGGGFSLWMPLHFAPSMCLCAFFVYFGINVNKSR